MINWKTEFGSREALEEQGWSQLGLTAGADVTVHGWGAKTGSPLANADSITREGGIRLSAGSSYHSDNTATGVAGAPRGSAWFRRYERRAAGTATPLALTGLLGLLSATATVGIRASRRARTRGRQATLPTARC